MGGGGEGDERDQRVSFPSPQPSVGEHQEMQRQQMEQHRANPGEQDPKAASGYVTEAYVIEQAQKAGFELVERSEVNANPADTKDHPFGVWTLPPVRQSSASGKPVDPAFDRAKYDAIGESDRMTLKFVKPKK